MKTSIRKSAFSVSGESYTLAERICIKHPKHGRYKKQRYLTKQARRSVEKGNIDGINLINKEYYE